MTTLAQALAMVAKYLEAETALLEGKQVRLSAQGGGADRVWISEDLPELRKGRMEWERRAAELQRQAAGAPSFGGISYSLADFSGR
jgi:hypothetical protein